MPEKITRGEVRQKLELLLRLNPMNFTKEVIYAHLASVVNALAQDLGKTQKNKRSSEEREHENK